MPSGTIIIKINEEAVYHGTFGKCQKVKYGLIILHYLNNQTVTYLLEYL